MYKRQVIGIALLLTLFVTDKGLKREEDTIEEKIAEAETGNTDHDPENSAQGKPNLIARFRSWRDSLVKNDVKKSPSVQLQSLDREQNSARSSSKSSLDSK